VGKVIAFVIALFVKVNKAVYEKGFADGVAHALREQTKVGEAMARDMDEIGRDNRNLDDAIDVLGGVRDQPGASRRDVP
jgi:hypothetical protein